MFRVSSRVRCAIAATALAASLAGCGASPDSAPPGPPPDLFQALPEPAAAPTTADVASPTTTKRTVASTVKPKPATAKPPPRVKKVAATGNTPTSAGAGWKPIGGDEFNAGSLDTAKWGRYDSVGAFGNGTRSPDAISQSGGQLHITATPGDGGVSGGMADSFGQTYGRWEFRARTAYGRGFGSAILLWPDSEKLADGELDMMEVPFEKRDLAHFVVHSGPSGNTLIGDSVPGDYSGWHTFALDWLPDRITWYVDGKKQFEVTDKARIPTSPMHITLQLDQGPKKDWIMAPDGTTPAEVNLDVDWVRVYAPATPVTPPA